jgi:hypothetical protein
MTTVAQASSARIVRVRVPLLGVEVTPLTAREFISLLLTQPKQATLALNHNLHSAYIWHESAEFRAITITRRQ